MAEYRSTSTNRPTGWQLPLGISVGAGIGLTAGVLLRQVAMGLLGGAAIGLLVATSVTSLMATPDPTRVRVWAVGIGLVTAGVVVIVWLLWS